MGILKDTYTVKNNTNIDTNIDTKPIADAIIKSNREKNKIEKEKIASKDRADITAKEYKEFIIENYKLEQANKELEERGRYCNEEKELYEDFLWKICRKLDNIIPRMLAKNSSILSVVKQDGDNVIDIRLEYEKDGKWW